MIKRILLLLVMAIFVPNLAIGQTGDPLGNTVSAPFAGDLRSTPQVGFEARIVPVNAGPGKVVKIIVKCSVIDNWHIYPIANGIADQSIGFPTELSFEANGLTALDDTFTPSSEPVEFSAFAGKSEKVHLGQFEWTRRYRVDEDASTYSGDLKIVFQACDETNCVPPKTLKIHLECTASGREPIVSESRLPGNSESLSPDSIVVVMEKYEARRPIVAKSVGGLMTSIFFGSEEKTEELLWKGTIPVDGNDIELFLAKANEYKIVNPETDNSRFSNKATYLSVDQNGDAIIEEYESFACNLPIRILDSMFKVTEIHPEGKSITLQKIDIPLFGVVLGRRCPEFWYETVDNQIVSNESLLGKVAILDVWAVT